MIKKIPKWNSTGHACQKLAKIILNNNGCSFNELFRLSKYKSKASISAMLDAMHKDKFIFFTKKKNKKLIWIGMGTPMCFNCGKKMEDFWWNK